MGSGFSTASGHRLGRRLAKIAAAVAGIIAAAPVLAQPMPVAVLGDSDSHSYRDDVKGIHRGGAYHDTTFNWLEVWARLRPDEIDPGRFEKSGDGRTAARIKAALGVATRVPAKRDYAYNYAYSGTGCASLLDIWPQQGVWLAARLRSNRRRWDDGLVVIRIGVNDFGQPGHLEAWSHPANTEEAEARVDACIDAVSRTVTKLRSVSAARIALVGISRDYNAPGTDAFAEDPVGLRLIASVLDRYDAGLQKIAAGDPRVAFVNDQDWFAARFGDRMRGDLRDSYKAGGVEIVNAEGAAPRFLILDDGHAGAMAAGFFADHLIRSLNASFGLNLTPIEESELLALAGLAPEARRE